MKYDFIYDSSTISGDKEYSLEKSQSDSLTQPIYVLFYQEGVYLEADAQGNTAIYNMDGVELFRDKADGNGKLFFGIYCKVSNGVISVRFPIQEVIDHYPHCDGEYDRYSYITKDNVVFHYNLCKE